MNITITQSPLKFRPAVLADILAVVALAESTYRGDASREGWTTEADLLDGKRTDVKEIEEIITKPHNRILLAEQEAKLLACCHIEKQDDVTYFGLFSVRPALQSRGIGKQVIMEAERIAHDEWKCREMKMQVITLREELIAYYERRGYRRTGIFKPFPYDIPQTIPKRPDLRFELLVKPLV